MLVSTQTLDQITELANIHRVIAIGEMHGVKENPEAVLEVYNTLKGRYSVILGFEYPQTLIDNLGSADPVLYQDGRFSPFHKELLENLKQDGVMVFGFDLDNDQLEEQKTQPIDWRDKIMAENINRQIRVLGEKQKILIVTGDMHYQTKVQSIMYPDKDGVMKPFEYLPMGSQLKVNSIFGIHLRYLSGQFYNFKLREMPNIDVNKNISFRENDDVIEIDIQEAHPTK
ncbi:MAG: hypothetical protein UT82_C0023G0002 [Parcubacteria group bacterium GW2011_GWB1_40_14]|nr:MAG: hypothetical protein UT82_C0023G0002 [Parcubacteria group bacterium GW2011_GWB1_40_14]